MCTMDLVRLAQNNIGKQFTTITASGDRPMESITGVPARSLKNNDIALLDYAVVTSE